MPAAPVPERRRARRIAVRRLAVLYHPPADAHDILHGQTSHKGVVTDLSSQGMRVLVREPMPVGAPLSLTLEVPVLHLEVPVRGRVTRCGEVVLKPAKGKAPSPPPVTYELGVSLSPNSTDFLEFLSRMKGNPLLRLGGI